MSIVSESRAAAADTGHRIDYPNSRPRALKLVGMGPGSAAITRQVRDHKFRHVEVLSVDSLHTGGSHSPSHMFEAIAADGHRLVESLEKADMIFMVATPNDDLGVAAEIGQLGRRRNILITGVLVVPSSAPIRDMDRALELLRAATDMLVIVSDAGYVIEMLTELGGGPAEAQPRAD